MPKSKEDEQTLEELNSAHRRSQAKCRLKQTSYIKQIKLLLFSPYNKHLINWAKSVCMGESWPWSLYRPHCVRSVLTTSVKILPYRPLARLIRANNRPSIRFQFCSPSWGSCWRGVFSTCLHSAWFFRKSFKPFPSFAMSQLQYCR